MREGSSEVGAIYRAVARGFRRVYIFASAAIELDGFFVRNIGQADGEKRLRLTKDTGTASEIDFLVFLKLGESKSVKSGWMNKVDEVYHLGKSPGCDDPSSVDQPVQQPGLNIQGAPQLVVDFIIYGPRTVRDETRARPPKASVKYQDCR